MITQGDFSISITDQAVEVRNTPSAHSPHGRLWGFIFSIGIIVAGACALLFLPGKHAAPSMWHNWRNAPSGSFDSYAPLIVLVLFVGYAGWMWSRYAPAAWAADEILYCDRETITIKRLEWMDFSNQNWQTDTYPLRRVSAIRYDPVASGKGSAIWGLRFQTRENKWVLPGLEAPEAQKILAGLKALGADVLDDPQLDQRVKRAHELRHGDASWTDTSWMNSNKH